MKENGKMSAGERDRMSGRGEREERRQRSNETGERTALGWFSIVAFGRRAPSSWTCSGFCDVKATLFFLFPNVGFFFFNVCHCSCSNSPRIIDIFIAIARGHRRTKTREMRWPQTVPVFTV